MTMQKISELADGELDGHEAAGAYAALKSGGEALAAWRRYHLISDAMRDTHLLSDGFAERVAARLAGEPTVLAPAVRSAPGRSLPWYATRVAAGVAAVAFVGFAAVSMLDQVAPPQVAKETRPAAPAPAIAVAEPAVVPASEEAKAYLHAHQGYSPRNGLQGHVQTVSGKAAR